MPAAIVPNRLPLLVIDEVALASELEPADTAAIYLSGAIEGEDVVLRRNIMVVVREQGAVLAAEDEVLLDQRVVAAFIGVVQHSAGMIEIPLAGSVQRLEDVLHPIDRGPVDTVAGDGRREESKRRAKRLGRSKATVRVFALTLSIGSRLSSHRVIPTTSTSRKLRQVGTMSPGA